uniref:Protein LURP-one-related 15-like n=1 Tax=Nelumbo nucifera TaxID=4432 RepID=A0A822YA65_NELNU|nr:TPA_asm: hypothetical protein HUJ06_029627 [Nelumbo nucifera]
MAYASTESSFPQSSIPVAVLGPQLCAPYPIDHSRRKFCRYGCSSNIIFKVKDTLLSLRDQRILLDIVENPLVSMQQKIMSGHRRWQVFRGDSSDSKDLLFSGKKSLLIQFKTVLDVFLATNTKEEVCDFKIKGSLLERSCIVYSRDSSNSIIIAQSVVLGNDTFAVTMYPNIDHAFIVALIVILDEINEDKAY